MLIKTIIQVQSVLIKGGLISTLYTYDEESVSETLFELFSNEADMADIPPESMVEDDQVDVFVVGHCRHVPRGRKEWNKGLRG